MNVQQFQSRRKLASLGASTSLDVQHWRLGFTNGSSSLKLCFSRILKCGQLNLECFEFWLPTSQLLALDVCLPDAFA
ncbi:TPA: DUF645 family protein [Vibrio cholerae]|nr:DUF645 family protein [Vibrio cholerae]